MEQDAMSRLIRIFAALVIGVGLVGLQPARTDEKPEAEKKRGWTLAEARAALALQPHDPYLQYVVLQLARRENKQEEVSTTIERLLDRERDDRSRTSRLDLFGIFTGALAVQESLQLDTMRDTPRRRGDRRNPAPAPPPEQIDKPEPGNPVSPPEPQLFTIQTTLVPVTETRKVPFTVTRQVPETVVKDGVAKTVFKPVSETVYKEVQQTTQKAVSVAVPLFPLASFSATWMGVSTPGPIVTATTLAAADSDNRAAAVDIGKLTGPTIKSHPWKKMLGERKPEISALARCVPDDFYFAEFRSVNKLLDAVEISDLWSTHVYNQAVREARTQLAVERLQEQLAVQTEKLLRPFYDQVVGEVAVTGSDLYLREGSDVTLIFQLKQPKLFKARMDAFLQDAEKKHADAKRTNGEHLGIAYVHVGSPEREVHVFSAYPRPDLHVRSNSLPGLQRILEAIEGKDAAGKKIRRLGDTNEFAYIRTLLPRGAKEEDGLIYLSDPFIRRQVGPRVKLAEYRRLRCYNHLRMIGHGSMMYRTEHGRAPASLEHLAKLKCTPGTFGKELLTCPDGGKYSLSADGNLGVCSHHGHVHLLKPCLETAPPTVTREEAEDYDAFLKDYNEYWRTYFDPIAIRLQAGPEGYRLETIVLPLIDNSIYAGLAKVLGGKPEPLDTLPVPKGNIFSVNFRLNKEALDQELQKAFKPGDEGEKQLAELVAELGVPKKHAAKLTIKNIRKVLNEGLGNQIGLHVYDAEPHVDFNYSRFGGEMVSLLNGRDRGARNAGIGLLLFLATSANSPGYFSIPIQNEAIVDDFVDTLDAVSAALAARRDHGITGGGEVTTDFYRIDHPSKIVIRGNGIQVGPVKWRFFAARIGKAYYIASKQYIIEDLIAAEANKGARSDGGPTAHAMVRVRPENWKKTLPDYRLGWCENSRQACLCNLGPLSNVGRAFATPIDESTAYAEAEAERRGIEIGRLANRQQGYRSFCPDGGKYLLDRQGRSMSCSIHGSVLHPRQHDTGADRETSDAMHGFTGMTVQFSLLEDGLRAVLTIDRKK
jgi:hypothetical protein